MAEDKDKKEDAKDAKDAENEKKMDDRMKNLEKSVEDIKKSILDISKAVEAKKEELKKAEGTAEGTTEMGSGEGDKVKLPKSKDEEVHEQLPGTSAGESVKLDKALELTELKKDMSEVKEILKSFKIEKAETGRPSTNTAINIEKSEEDLALKVARGEAKLNHSDLASKSYNIIKSELDALFNE